MVLFVNSLNGGSVKSQICLIENCQNGCIVNSQSGGIVKSQNSGIVNSQIGVIFKL